MPLRGKEAQKNLVRRTEADNARCIGGLARSHTSTLRCPGLVEVGRAILSALEPIVARNGKLMDQCLDGLGTEDCPNPPEALLDEVRSAIGATFR